MIPKVLIIFLLIITTIGCGKRYRLTDDILKFNVYKKGDSLVFKSNKNARDTIIITSIRKETLQDKSYTLFDAIDTFLFGEKTERYFVSYAQPGYDSRFSLGHDLLTISADPNEKTSIMFDFFIGGATWYGNTEIENNINKLLSIPVQNFNRDSCQLSDVIVIPSSNQEYKERNDYVEKIYWSKSHGLVGFDKLNGEKWTLINK